MYVCVALCGELIQIWQAQTHHQPHQGVIDKKKDMLNRTSDVFCCITYITEESTGNTLYFSYTMTDRAK